jgi:DNA polymerase III epsilon subunit-like protein
MSSYNIPKFGLAIDFETSGFSMPDFASKHQGISFGAIIFDARSLDAVETIYHEVKFNDKYEWSSGAEKVHGLTREHLRQHGVEPAEAAEALINMVVKYNGLEEIMLMGHRVHFDRSFTDQLTDSVGIRLPIHSTTIDTASMATVLLETSRSEEVFTMLGMPPRGKHNALEDIQNTLHAVRRMKELFMSGVAQSFNE